MYPNTCNSFYESPEDDYEKKRFESPTIVTPTNVIPAPTIWFFITYTFKNIFENIKVVIMVPPLIIWYTEPDTKFSAIKWRDDVMKSNNPGMAK